MENELIYHYEVADSQFPGGDAVAGEVHHGGESGAEDYVLSRVEESEGCGYFYRGAFIVVQGGVVAAHFVFFVVEVLITRQ